MLIPSVRITGNSDDASLSRRVNANSQLINVDMEVIHKLIKKGEC